MRTRHLFIRKHQMDEVEDVWNPSREYQHSISSALSKGTKNGCRNYHQSSTASSIRYLDLKLISNKSTSLTVSSGWN
ncbi:hypothetical protein [uncultured Shewanella sp.]|uniref:hypothetical protein n=1 Tax=uncultured Shewanella sp. TaxID=173975 RepID=UPI00261C5650|nr:hypothetical protein [uncultured Shewanella sp.]